MTSTPGSHGDISLPSSWVLRFARLARGGGSVLDVAAGYGRHARALAAAGYAVEALERDRDALAALRAIAGITVRAADLEGEPWPYAERRFDAIVATNYLWRALLPALARSLAPDGVLIYETFAVGNEKFGKPSNPDYLLREGELLDFARAWQLRVIAYEHGITSDPKRAVVQRLCAVRRGPRSTAAVPDDTLP